MKSRNRILSFVIWLALVAAVCVPYSVPVPPWQPVVEIERPLTSGPRTRTFVREFHVSHTQPSHCISVDSDTREGRFSIAITGNRDAGARYDIWPGRHKQLQSFHDPWGLRRGETYSIHIDETRFVGRYLVRLYPTADESIWTEEIRAARATFAAFVLAALALGLIAYCRVCRRAEPPSRRVPLVLLVGFIPLLDTIYGVAHEFGHHIVMLCCGAADFASSDYLGISGRTYADIAIGSSLTDWQNALMGLSGALFPTLAGYALFAAIALAHRKRPGIVATIWGAGLLMVMLRLLLSQLTFVLLMMSPLDPAADGHYSYFVEHYRGSVLAFNLLMALLAAIGVGMGMVAIKWFVAERRKAAAARP